MQLTRLATTAALCATIVTSSAITSSTASAAVAVRGTFTPVDPTRILDTRDGTGVADQHRGPLGAGKVIELDVTGVAGAPDDGVGAVVLNVTVTDAANQGYVTVYPCGDARPIASNVNFMRGVDAAGLTPVRIGATGKVCVYVSEGTDVVADLNGYYTLVV